MSNEVKQSPVLKLKPGTVSADVIVCGDAARALKIAQHFDSYEQVAARREYVVYTGIKNGHRLTVAAHGVGAAGAAICFEELILFGARNIIRIGTAGSYDATQERGDVIIATGARPRKLGLELEDELQGRGVSYCATCDGNFFRDKTVMVVGGGNTAAGDAIYLSRICKKVYLVHRRDKLRATAIYHKRLEDLPNLEFVWNAVPRKLVADEGALAGVRVEMLETGEERDIAVDGLFVAVGTEPNTEFLAGALTTDETGYIVAGESGETEVPGVYVAGDVRTKFLRQVVTAVADGALCAEEAAEYLAI